MKPVLVGLLVLVAVGVAARAEEPLEIELRRPLPYVGQVERTTYRHELSDGAMLLKLKNKVARAKFSLVLEMEWERIVLAMERGSVTKFQTRYLKHRTTERTQDAGRAESVNEVIGALAGQVVISQRVNGQWTHTLKGGPATEKQKAALCEVTGWNDDEATPAGKRPLGTAWEVDGTRLANALGGALMGVSGKLNVVFRRIEDVEGERCATVEATGRVKGKVNTEGTVGDVEWDLKVLEYLPILRRDHHRTMEEGALKMFLRFDDQTTAEMSARTKGEMRVDSSRKSQE